MKNKKENSTNWNCCNTTVHPNTALGYIALKVSLLVTHKKK
jgi:hypothetical protein